MRLIQDMFNRSVTAVRTTVSITDFTSALSPFVLTVLMDRLTNKMRQ